MSCFTGWCAVTPCQSVFPHGPPFRPNMSQVLWSRKEEKWSFEQTSVWEERPKMTDRLYFRWGQTEGEGFVSCAAALHQGAIGMFLTLGSSLVVHLSYSHGPQTGYSRSTSGASPSCCIWFHHQASQLTHQQLTWSPFTLAELSCLFTGLPENVSQ